MNLQKGISTRIIVYVVLLSFTLIFLIPVGIMVAGSFKHDDLVLVEAGRLQTFFPAELRLDNYRDVFARVPFARYMGNSLFISATIVISGLLVNSLAGYALARLNWPGRRYFLAAVVAVLIIPLEAIAVPLFYEVTLLGWRNTYLVQIVPFIANAFSIYLFYTFFLGIPRELEEAARIDGASTLRIFFNIILPNSKPVFATIAILTFLTHWGAFLWPLMVTHSEDVRPFLLGLQHFIPCPLYSGEIYLLSG